jgi:cytochrome c-type biogenesis protein CcmE
LNKQLKKRLIIVTLIIVVVSVITLAYVGSSGVSKVVSVAQARTGEFADQRVQISGTVVDNSFTTTNSSLTFAMYDADRDASEVLNVVYNGPVSTTFGNGIVAICTGKLDANGILQATELITKCPSKYESAEGSVTALYLNENAARMVGQDVKLAGYIKTGSLAAAQSAERFIVYSQGAEVRVAFAGALPDAVVDEAAVVVSGALDASGLFVATDVALEKVD